MAARSPRRNAGEGSDWGPDGEAAFEMEMAVRDALAGARPSYATWLEEHPESVASSLRPEMREQIARWNKNLHVQIEPKATSVLVFGLPAEMGDDTADSIHDARQFLDENWSPAGYEWWWNALAKGLPGIYDFSMGKKPWRPSSYSRADEFLVLRIDRDDSDTYAVPLRGRAVGEAMIDALAIAVPDEGSRVEFTTVFSTDASSARIAAPHRKERQRPWETYYHAYAPTHEDLDENPPRVYRPQKVVAQLQKETRPDFRKGSIVSAPEDVVYALSEYMGKRAHELFIALFIDVRNKIVGYTEFTSGSVAEVEIHGSGLFREALASGAAAVITAHQHPTGDPSPSEADFALWKRLREIGTLLGVPVIDNLVIGETRYYSESQKHGGEIPLAAREGSS